MKPNPAICNDDEIVPGEILAPPSPNPASAADADVKNDKSVICWELLMIPLGVLIISEYTLPVMNPKSIICAEDDTVPALTTEAPPNPKSDICCDDDIRSVS